MATPPTQAKPLSADAKMIGTWVLVSYELRDGENGIAYPLGKDAQGQIIYDNVGNMSCHLINPHPPARPDDASDGVAYEARMSYERYSSYFGRYVIDEVNREIRHHVIGALMPGWAGTTVVRSYAFDGQDTLTLSAMTGSGGQQAVLKWRRARRENGSSAGQ